MRPCYTGTVHFVIDRILSLFCPGPVCPRVVKISHYHCILYYYPSRITISDCHCTDQHSWRNAWLLALMKFSSKVTTTLFSVAVRRSETKLCSPFRVNPFNNFWAKFSVLIPFVSGSHIVSELGQFGGQNLPHSPFAMSFFKVWILYSIFRDPCGSKKYCSY